MKPIFIVFICTFAIGNTIYAEENVPEVTENPNKCEGSDILVANSNTSTVVLEGQNVVLPCKFHVPMNCKWELDKHIPLLVDRHRYHYCQQHSGENVMDCSIIIEQYQASMDSNTWHCTGISSGRVLHKQTLSYNLTGSTPTPALNPSPEAQEDPAVLTVTDTAATEKDTINESPDVTTTHAASEDVATTVMVEPLELSMTAKDPEHVDIPTTDQDKPDQTQNLEAPSTDIEIVDPPTNATLSVGDSLTLTCVFNTKVMCSWTKNGEKFDPHSPFMYNNGENTENCTLTADSVSVEGLTEWTCSAEHETVFKTVWVEIILDNSGFSNDMLVSSSETPDKMITPPNLILGSEPSTDIPIPASTDLERIMTTPNPPTPETESSSSVITKSNITDIPIPASTDLERIMTTPNPTTPETEPSSSVITKTNITDSSIPKVKSSPAQQQENSTKGPPSVERSKNIHSEDQLQTASSTAVTIIISSVVICLIGIAIAVSLCLYKRRKHIYTPNQVDSLVVHETRPSSTVAATENGKEVEPLILSDHPNGQPKEKLKESDSSKV